MIEIFHSKQGALLCGNMLRHVAGTATHPDMFSVEDVTSRRMVESLGRRIPMNHLEIHSVVIGMAFDARCSRRCRSRKSGMQSGVMLQFASNFTVTFDAFERWSSRRNLVALNAIRVSAQRLMRRCQWPRRNLRTNRYLKNDCADQYRKRPKPGAHSPRLPELLFSIATAERANDPALGHRTHPCRGHNREQIFLNAGRSGQTGLAMPIFCSGPGIEARK